MEQTRNKRLMLAAGIALCGALCAGGAEAATVESDEAVQRAGHEFNRRYDMEHGYYVPPAMEISQAVASRPVQRPRPVVSRQDNMGTQLGNAPRAVRPVSAQSNPQVKRQLLAQPQQRVNRQQALRQGQAAQQAMQQQRQLALQQQRQQQALRQQQVQQHRQAVAPQQMQLHQQKQLVKPEWMQASERDRIMQERALAYNRQFDMRYAR